MKYINKHIEEYIQRLPNLDQLQREGERERDCECKAVDYGKPYRIASHRIERSVMASTAINATVISKFFLGPVQVFYQLYDLAIKWARDIIFNISTPLSLCLFAVNNFK